MTLDEDNALRLTRLRQERDASLKEVVNEVIRRGLDEAEKPFRREPFQTRAMHLGPLLYPDLKQAMEAIQDEEDLRKLGLK